MAENLTQGASIPRPGCRPTANRFPGLRNLWSLPRLLQRWSQQEYDSKPGLPWHYITTFVNGQLPPFSLVDFRQKMGPELRVSSAHTTQITNLDSAAAIEKVMAGYLGIISDGEQIGPAVVGIAHKIVEVHDFCSIADLQYS